MIEVMFQVRKDGFKDNKAVDEGLDVVEEQDQFTHLITLDEATDPQDILSKFDNFMYSDFKSNIASNFRCV
jgi:pre-mRNA-splicing factor CWC22